MMHNSIQKGRHIGQEGGDLKWIVRQTQGKGLVVLKVPLGDSHLER